MDCGGMTPLWHPATFAGYESDIVMSQSKYKQLYRRTKKIRVCEPVFEMTDICVKTKAFYSSISSPSTKRTKRPTLMFSPVFAIDSLRMSCTFLS
jgi:hypothetical protein